MQKFKILVLTDHLTHNVENSIYALLRAMSMHPRNAGIDVASRGNAMNDLFFTKHIGRSLYVSPANESFDFFDDGRRYKKQLRRAGLQEYDFLFLRLPPPIDPAFWAFLLRLFPERRIINSPLGILETSNKKFLLHFPDLCPPMHLCQNLDDIREFKERHPIVLKPLNSYGGRGIVRIDGDTVWEGMEKKTFRKFAQELEQLPHFEYLGMKYLTNVSQGDKRIIVCNGQVLGATLRKPATGSWLCNAAQGGQPYKDDLTPEEWHIADRLKGEMAQRGIVMYGIDTLVDDDGRRVLSEINTLSIGGIKQMESLNNEPIVKRVANLLWDYVKDEMYGRSATEA